MRDQSRNNRLPTVAIPRVLWWFRLWPFWKTFFEGLGCRVATNDPARPTPRHRQRASTIVEEACFPMQLLIDRTLAIAGEADAIFMPRLISVVPSGIMCPRFAGVPDIVRMVLEQDGRVDAGSGKREAGNGRREAAEERPEARGERQGTKSARKEETGNPPASCVSLPPPASRLSPPAATGCQPVLLTPIIDARLGRGAIRQAYLRVAAQLGVSAASARQAYREAAAVQERFEAEFETRLNTLPMSQVFDPAIPTRDSGSCIPHSEHSALRIPHSAFGTFRTPHSAIAIALLGHPYITYDWEFNLAIVDKLWSLGLWVVPVESVSRKRIEASVRKLDKNVYWSSGREVLGAALSFFKESNNPHSTFRIPNSAFDSFRIPHSAFPRGVIYLSCFKCGVDGLLTDVVRWAARHQSQVAYLPLTLDGHDNEMGLMTRLEAFADIVRRRGR